MLGWLRRKKAHPHARELAGIVTCLLAFRRTALEVWRRTGEAPVERLEKLRQQLRLYAAGSGLADPFTASILEVPVGELDQELFLEGSYRIETAGAVGWALGLFATLPPPTDRIDRALLEELFPQHESPSPALKGAELRDRGELEGALAAWTAKAVTARARRDARPGDEQAAVEFSRAYERARGLAWVLSNAPFVEDVDVEL